MTSVAIATACFLLLFFAGQAGMTLSFLLALQRFQRKLLDDEQCPKAAAILCLRGKDPFLEDCLAALLDQDYPNYSVRVVVDHESDPVFELASRCVEQSGVEQSGVEQSGVEDARVDVLVERRETCSLKCSSLVQAVSELDASFEVIALLDADTVPHRSWLRELVTPLSDEGVGGATGNRWYMPERASLGALVRYFWNAFAIVQMYCFGIAWGGSLAVRLDVVRQANLLDRWSRSFCEDTMLFGCLRENGYRVAFVPSLIMINREDCGLENFFHWVRRQLLTARLYHPRWPGVICHGVITACIPLLLVSVACGAIVNEDRVALAWLGAGVGLYLVLMSTLLPLMESRVRHIVRARDEPTNWMSWSVLAILVPAISLLQVIYPLALASASRLRRVDWRGVEYDIHDSGRIRLIEYRPYQGQQEKANESL